jgi:N-acetylneuraminate synthase/N,N'-diacetyllegionaminate synthase
MNGLEGPDLAVINTQMTIPGFKKTFKIGDRLVGPGAPVLFIAEAGVAHFGDMEMAYRLIDLAVDAGADVFKTQFFDVEAMIAASAQDWRDRLAPRNLSFEQFSELKAYCDKRGILFMSTAHDATRIPWLRDLDLPAVKVGSGERNNPAFLAELAGLGKPMIISTGMYALPDVAEALHAIAAAGCDEAALLHCVTAYPAPDEDVNLAAMARLTEIFDGPVGYSDHTPDTLAVLAAVARGARVIEKHITIDRDIPNAQDWKVAAGPENLPGLIADIRRLDVMMGHGRKERALSEQAGEAWALKSIVAARDLSVGEVIGEADLAFKRPGTGLSPNRVDEILGRALGRDIAADDFLTLDAFEDK